MTKVTIEGPAARIICDILYAKLRELTIDVSAHYDMKPSEVAPQRGKDTRKKVSVSIVAMSK
jgi:hypothetical protein